MRGVGPLRPLGDRPDDPDLVEASLHLAGLGLAEWRRAGDHHHAHRVRGGVADAGDGVEQARPGGDCRDAYVPGGACIPVGRVDRRRLVSAIDQRDAEPATTGQEGIQMSAVQREHHLDTGLTQRPGGKFTPVQRRIDMHRFPPECES